MGVVQHDPPCAAGLGQHLVVSVMAGNAPFSPRFPQVLYSESTALKPFIGAFDLASAIMTLGKVHLVRSR
jgi:hypothetical protein